MGNSLKLDNSLGKETSYYAFKSNYSSSDFGNVTTKSHFNDLISLNSPVTTGVISKYNFGSNKLIPRKATTLITSSKILNLNESLVDINLEDSGISSFNDSFLNFSFDQTYPTKPDFVNHQLTFFSSINSFQNSLSFLNTPDLNSYLTKVSGIINNSDTASAFKLKSCLLNSGSSEKLPFNSNKLGFFFRNATLLAGTNKLPFSLVADQDFKR